MKGGPFGEKKFLEKSFAVPKKIERGDPLVSPGMVCYAEKQEKLFWFSSLGQMVQFGAIIFCRTFKNYFGQFVWIKKVTIIVAFHFIKRRLKTESVLKQSLFSNITLLKSSKFLLRFRSKPNCFSQTKKDVFFQFFQLSFKNGRPS